MWSRQTQHGNTQALFWFFGFFIKLFPDISQYTYKCQKHLNFQRCFHSYKLSVFSSSRNQEVRRGCTKPPQFKRLPLFLKHANGAILQGLILAHLYAFVLSKCMCVFSPLLFLLLCCRFIPGPNRELPLQGCVPGSSPHLPFLFPPNGLKLLHPRLLTGLPGTTERISTQIKQLCSRGAKDLKPD